MAKHQEKLTPELIGILSRVRVSATSRGWVGYIADGQLDRKVYEALNGALEALGGKWNRHAKGHVFPEDPTGAIESLLATGTYRTKFDGDFFQTPEPVARQMAEWAVRPGDRVLEPSAGHGRLARAALAAGAAQVDCFEIMPARAAELDRLREAGAALRVTCIDFLVAQPEPYDAVVMNSPFMRGAAAGHVLHAARFLRPGGRLAALGPKSLRYREDEAHLELRALLGPEDIEELPPRSFSAEGTDIDVLMLTWQKP